MSAFTPRVWGEAINSWGYGVIRRNADFSGKNCGEKGAEITGLLDARRPACVRLEAPTDY